ncbi:hypothetical protein RhiirA1_199962 [Rhizophagus irregularis]|uniref:Uncharacterized protein n=1 Tax=Rhizophagus irregularis TaxID=588596 RepID=A0A2N0RQB5_9GLOM|nr:hypothetical protein RhiirA1_199962 [Rhizophagus irregularis]
MKMSMKKKVFHIYDGIIIICLQITAEQEFVIFLILFSAQSSFVVIYLLRQKKKNNNHNNITVIIHFLPINLTNKLQKQL